MSNYVDTITDLIAKGYIQEHGTEQFSTLDGITRQIALGINKQDLVPGQTWRGLVYYLKPASPTPTIDRVAVEIHSDDQRWFREMVNTDNHHWVNQINSSRPLETA